MRKFHWSPQEISEIFSTEQILEKLQGFGITVTPEEFLEDVGQSYGSSEIYDRWEERYTITAEGFDEDFPWMSAIVLWERLAPDVVDTEKLCDWIDDGYILLKKKKQLEACDIWLEVWEGFKKRFCPEMKSIEDLEQFFDDIYPDDWCDDLQIELANAGLEDLTYNAKRMEYCQEFCRLFPESDDVTIENMKRGEGESLFRLGRAEEGDKLFEDLVKQFPKSPWPYISWGDMYCSRINSNMVLDYDKAEAIYRRALKNKVDELKEVRKRLKDLSKERAGKGFGGDIIDNKKKKKSKKK